MSHRTAVVLSLAITLVLAVAVYAGRDRLMAVDDAAVAITPTAAAASDAFGQAAPPPLSPAERAATDRSALPTFVPAAAADDGDDRDAEAWGDDEDDEHDDEHPEEHDEEHEDDDDD